MKSATQCLWDYSIDIMTMQDDFNCQLFAAMERYAEGYYADKVGLLEEGQHPDEILPRSGTWLKERECWKSEIKAIKEHFLLTIQVLRTMMVKANMDEGVKKCDEIINKLNP